jgi:hypothetical protein
VAVVATFRLEHADHDDHERLSAAIEAAIEASGAPPDGLLVHVAHPDADGGFVSIEVFRNEDAYRRFWSDVVEPALASVGLRAVASPPQPVWSLSRP